MDTLTQEILNRIRMALHPWQDHITEKRMFGGTSFLYKGKMCVGETKHRLMVRVLEKEMSQALAHPDVSPMDFTGRPLKEFIFVRLEGYHTQEKLQYWIEQGIAHAQSKTEKP